MKVSDLLSIETIRKITPIKESNQPIDAYYCSELLSYALGNIRKKNTVLLTVLRGVNTIAVASLLELSAVIFCNNVEPDELTIQKAIEENIPCFISSESSADTLIRLNLYETIL